MTTLTQACTALINKIAIHELTQRDLAKDEYEALLSVRAAIDGYLRLDWSDDDDEGDDD